MALLAFDPHPYGCPLSIATDPAGMRALLPEIVLRLLDVFRFSVHVVEPSRGEPYPLLNIQESADSGPRMVLFPGWEDARQRRRVDYKRQTTLLKRIRTGNVPPERVEDVVKDLRNTVQDDPLVLRLACTAAQMPQAITDLDHYLGDTLRLTVQTLDPKLPIPTRIVRMYAPTSESAPRIIAFPAWRAAAEVPTDAWSDEDCDGMLDRLEVEVVPEVPVEVHQRDAGYR